MRLLHCLLHCLLNRHEPHRHRVRPADDGTGDLTGRCRHCGTRIRRLGYRRWRREGTVGARRPAPAHSSS